MGSSDLEFRLETLPIKGLADPELAYSSSLGLDVARCYLWLFTLYINIKISKNSC